MITPNAVEFSLLVSVILNKEVSPSVCPDHQLVEELAGVLGNLTVIHKGAHDVISDGKYTEDCHTGVSPRRCGGQGDILAGVTATFLTWAYTRERPDNAVLAAWAATTLGRGCAARAYSREGRGVTAVDIVNQISTEFRRLYESETAV